MTGEAGGVKNSSRVASVFNSLTSNSCFFISVAFVSRVQSLCLCRWLENHVLLVVKLSF